MMLLPQNRISRSDERTVAPVRVSWAEVASPNKTSRASLGGNVDDDQDLGSQRNLGIGIALGIALGAGIGVALDNLALWIGIGVAMGAALGSISRGKRSSGAPTSAEPGGRDDA